MTGYPQIGFNPYNMYQNWGYGYQYPAFLGVQNLPQPASVPQPNVNLQTPPDTVSFKATEHIQTKPKKEGLSTGAKWGLGALALAGVGTAVYFATRGKVGAKQAQTLAEHIEFKPAKTVEEAKKFAQEKLDVMYYEELGKFEDVGMLNFINEWMVKTHNNPKFGKNSYPRVVYNDDCRGALMSMSSNSIIIDGIDYGYGLGINLKKFKELEPQALRQHNIDLGIIKKMADGKYNITKPQLDNKYTRRLVKNLNADTLSFEDKMQLILDLQAYKNRKVVDGVMNIRVRKVHNYINHEQGHLLHSKICDNYQQMSKVEEFASRGQEVSEITKEFINNKEIQATAGKVSDYAKESPLEFVAETFAGLRDGIKFPDDVMALYKKYGGPVLT